MKIFGVYLFGALFGVLLTWLIMSESESLPPPTIPESTALSMPQEAEAEVETDPFSTDSPPSYFVEESWRDRLFKKSGKWLSIDGLFEASLDGSLFSLSRMPNWANVEQRTFQLFEEQRFLSGNGYYSIHFKGENNDRIRLIRQDATTGDYNGITLYHEENPKANSRKPLPKTEIPKKIQEMLAKINTVLGTDTASMALGRIGLKSFRSMEHLDGESRWGETRGVIDLGIEGEWMIKYANSQKSGVFELQIFRGLVTEYRETGETLEELVYPHIYGDYIVESPSKYRKFR